MVLSTKVLHFPCCGGWRDKKGNSHTQERVDLLEEFVELFCEYKIAYITADREFLGHDWLDYLLSQPMISFRIRIRENDCREWRICSQISIANENN